MYILYKKDHITSDEARQWRALTRSPISIGPRWGGLCGLHLVSHATDFLSQPYVLEHILWALKRRGKDHLIDVIAHDAPRQKETKRVCIIEAPQVQNCSWYFFFTLVRFCSLYSYNRSTGEPGWCRSIARRSPSLHPWAWVIQEQRLLDSRAKVCFEFTILCSLKLLSLSFHVCNSHWQARRTRVQGPRVRQLPHRQRCSGSVQRNLALLDAKERTPGWVSRSLRIYFR